MSLHLADTHALLWYLAGSSRLSGAAKQVFEQAKTGQATAVSYTHLTLPTNREV